MKKKIAHLGLDVHKESISYALFVGHQTKPIVEGKVKPDSKAFNKKIRQWNDEYILTVVYEASGCGYWLYRKLLAMEVNCRVVAPTSIPKDNRGFKYDRLDAKDLAIYARAGKLSYVMVPDEESEADRDLVRLRASLVKDTTRTILQISAMLLRAGIPCPHKSSSVKYLPWLHNLVMEDKPRQVLEHYIDLLKFKRAMIQQVEDEISQLAQTDKYREPCKILQGFLGIRETIAMNLLTNIVDFRCFSSPSKLFCWAGMVSSKHSSAEKDPSMKITKKGNSMVRRSLILAVQKYSAYKRKTRVLINRQKDVEPKYVSISDRAIRRLRKRYWHLHHQGKHNNKIKVAMARELLGFIWEAMIVYHGGEIISNRVA